MNTWKLELSQLSEGYATFGLLTHDRGGWGSLFADATEDEPKTAADGVAWVMKRKDWEAMGRPITVSLMVSDATARAEV